MQAKITDISRSTLQLPISLQTWVIQNRYTNLCKLYFFLNASCSGKRKISNPEIQAMADTLQVSSKTIRNQLQKLKNDNWIGYNPKSKYWHIRGVRKLMKALKLTGLTMSELDVRELIDLKAFLASSCIGYLVNAQKKKQKNNIESKKSAERKPVICSNQPDLSNFQGVPLANVGMAKCLGISKSYASSLKQLARKAGHIEVIKAYNDTGYSASELSYYRRANPEIAHLTTVRSGKVMLRKPDLVICTMKYKTCRNRAA